MTMILFVCLLLVPHEAKASQGSVRLPRNIVWSDCLDTSVFHGQDGYLLDVSFSMKETPKGCAVVPSPNMWCSLHGGFDIHS